MIWKTIDVTAAELRQVREISDRELTLFLSEVHDHGWPCGRKLLALFARAIRRTAEDPKEAARLVRRHADLIGRTG